MLIERGALLVALTRSVVCARCHNAGPHGVFQYYEKGHGPFFYGTNYFDLFSMCPVCETKIALTKVRPFFSSARTMADLINLLDEGRESTKHWFDRLDASRREDVLKRLNSLKAYNLVKYLGLPAGAGG